jgi:LysM repeat protein
MKTLVAILLAISVSAALIRPVSAQDTSAQSLAVMEEKLNKLRAEVEALQFNQEKMKKQIADVQTQLLEVRRSSGTGSTVDVSVLEARIKAVDIAREKDKQVILDTLAKELAALSAGKSGTKPPTAVAGKEHVVQKGENLTAIAKACGVSVADLKKANNLTGDDIKVGQKLVIPK